MANKGEWAGLEALSKAQMPNVFYLHLLGIEFRINTHSSYVKLPLQDYASLITHLIH